MLITCHWTSKLGFIVALSLTALAFLAVAVVVERYENATLLCSTARVGNGKPIENITEATSVVLSHVSCINIVTYIAAHQSQSITPSVDMISCAVIQG